MILMFFVKRCTKLHLLREIKGAKMYKNEKICVNLFANEHLELGDVANTEVGGLGKGLDEGG